MAGATQGHASRRNGGLAGGLSINHPAEFPRQQEKTPFHFPGIVLQPQNARLPSTVSIHFLLGPGHRLFAPALWSTRPPLQPDGLMLSPLTTFGASHLCFASCHAMPTWRVPTLLFPCELFSSFLVPSSSNLPLPLLLTPSCVTPFFELFDHAFHV